jgi:hypothetical protein
MNSAVDDYKTEQQKLQGQKMLGLHGVCKLMERECWEKDKKVISLDKSTLTRQINGVLSQAQSNAQGGWLTDGEADVVVSYANRMANEGWPLSRRRTLEHAQEICVACYGTSFAGLGINWIDGFISKHSTHLKGSWSRPLDKIWA